MKGAQRSNQQVVVGFDDLDTIGQQAMAAAAERENNERNRRRPKDSMTIMSHDQVLIFKLIVVLHLRN